MDMYLEIGQVGTGILDGREIRFMAVNTGVRACDGCMFNDNGHCKTLHLEDKFGDVINPVCETFYREDKTLVIFQDLPGEDSERHC